jgi:hypothetical protein
MKDKNNIQNENKISSWDRIKMSYKETAMLGRFYKWLKMKNKQYDNNNTFQQIKPKETKQKQNNS